MSKYVLFLDDDLGRIQEFIRKSSSPYIQIATTAADCIQYLREFSFDLLHLDHDLDHKIFVNEDEPNTGSEVVRWLVVNKPPISHIIVHTLNSKAGMNMVKALAAAGYKVSYEPWGRPECRERSKIVNAFITREVEV